MKRIAIIVGLVALGILVAIPTTADIHHDSGLLIASKWGVRAAVLIAVAVIASYFTKPHKK